MFLSLYARVSIKEILAGQRQYEDSRFPFIIDSIEDFNKYINQSIILVGPMQINSTFFSIQKTFPAIALPIVLIGAAHMAITNSIKELSSSIEINTCIKGNKIMGFYEKSNYSIPTQIGEITNYSEDSLKKINKYSINKEKLPDTYLFIITHILKNYEGWGIIPLEQFNFSDITMPQRLVYL